LLNIVADPKKAASLLNGANSQPNNWWFFDALGKTPRPVGSLA
jgi:hypothetical protein